MKDDNKGSILLSENSNSILPEMYLTLEPHSTLANNYQHSSQADKSLLIFELA